MITQDNKDQLKNYVVEAVLKNLPDIKSRVQEYVDKEVDVEAIMKSKPQASANEFMEFIEVMLTSEPAMIIAYGGLFGGLIGVIQWLMV